MFIFSYVSILSIPSCQCENMILEICKFVKNLKLKYFIQTLCCANPKLSFFSSKNFSFCF